MALALNDQFVEAIKRARSVVVVFRSAWTGDSLGSALAIAALVEKIGKPVEVVCHNFAAPETFKFLPGLGRVGNAIKEAQRLRLKFNLEKTSFSNLSYEVHDGELHIILTPKSGTFDPSGLKIEPSAWKHDLIITVDAADLDQLGDLVSAHHDFFYKTPIVNIDHDPSNEHYGSINIVDMRASSTSEVVTELVESIDSRLLDPTIATCLLTGLISKTKSFRTPNVTPKTLQVGARLVAAGGNRAEIVERLFRTRPVEALRLWGRVLARLKADHNHKIVWSMLTRADFSHAGADETHLADVIDELITNSPDAEVVCILHEHPKQLDTISGIIATERAKNAMHLAAPWKPEGNHRLAKIMVKNTSLPLLEKEVIDNVRQIIAAAH